MADFRVKLKAEDRPAAVADRGDGAGFGRSQRNEVSANGLHLVAMTHPHDGFLGHPGKQAVDLLDMTMRPPELAARTGFHFSTQDLAGQLHAIANAKCRNAK